MSRDSHIPDRLLQVTRDLRRSYDGRARGVRRTLSGATLARHDRITQTQLAALLAIALPMLKRQIDALVAGGFFERRSQ